VTTRYFVHISAAIWARREGWVNVAGWRVLEDTATPIGNRTVEVMVEDDDAPRELEGHLVDVTLQQTPEGVVVMSRELID
jgi:hypothetical protein